MLPLGQSPGSPAPLRRGTPPLGSQEQEGASSSASASPADTISKPTNPSPHAFGNATETAQRSQTTKPSTGGDAFPSRPLPATALGWPFSFYFSRGDFPEGNYNKKINKKGEGGKREAPRRASVGTVPTRGSTCPTLAAGSAGQSRVGSCRAGQGWAELNRAEPSRAGSGDCEFPRSAVTGASYQAAARR